jgi:hypothetical protein
MILPVIIQEVRTHDYVAKAPRATAVCMRKSVKDLGKNPRIICIFDSYLELSVMTTGLPYCQNPSKAYVNAYTAKLMVLNTLFWCILICLLMLADIPTKS